MDTMAYTNTYGFYQNYDLERQSYYEPSIYHPEVPLFTQQELSGFEPALAQMVLGGGNDMGMPMAGCWEPQEKATGIGYGEMASQFFSHEPAGFGMDMDMDMDIGYPQPVDLYAAARCFPAPEQIAGSCQPSPFLDQSRLPFQTSFQQPVSPVTPAGSPLQYGAALGLMNTTPPAFLLVPVEDSNGQYQYSAYQVPMDDYITPPSYQNNQSAFESSPHMVPSLVASPLTREAPASENAEEDDEEEEEDVRSVLPNCGNTELRGMGLYDDTPDLMFCPTPGGCSPVTPHDQIRPTLGKGLVLERSFGLPEKMMMKDEESGKIIEGKLQIDEDEY
ncbi:hypothetical protein FN846DRAFT_310509 [Sphaerosporella brunnea]|uniref:Uncharacterized protein n=1 Tax=Sphaerosporella brunnea TaxID=1250544 RepID=A0A5J5F6X5_9PEZI|nr:hypothetical protein FN846DRAFT_310509 [Sphaerosporella brunnea]